METIDAEDFEDLFLSNRPLLDVRAPVEFSQGAFPTAVNAPLLDDQQRHEIGKRYAEMGQDAAIELGLELATPDIRDARLRSWQSFLDAHPQGALYCFRGGLRSRTAQEWMAEAGLFIPLVRGGYKALRRFLLTRLDELIDNAPLLVVAGPTGSGKTDLLLEWPHSLDLEGMAHHKGSAFGQEFRPQPSQIDWEHRLTTQWMKRTAASPAPVLVEDESRLIGRIYVPNGLQRRLQSAPEIRLLVSMEQRVERLRRDYVQPIVDHYQSGGGLTDWPSVEEHIRANLQRIRKRLGGARHDDLQRLLTNAVAALGQQDDWGAFDQLIRSLLTDYYDPMYRYQQQKQNRPCLCEGTQDEVLAWLHREQNRGAA